MLACALLLCFAGQASAATVWTPLIASDASTYSRFGRDIAVSQDAGTVVVGNPTRKDSAGASIAGAIHIYQGIPAANNLTRTEDVQVIDTDPAPTPTDNFGTALAISADGSTIAVGAAWSQTAKINRPAGMSSLFGDDVALSGDGSKLLVGAPGLYSSEQGGAAFFGRNPDATWSLVTTVAGGVNGSHAGTGVAISDDGSTWSSLATVSNPSGLSGLSSFGESVSFSANGSRLAVGAPDVTTIGTTSVAGAAYVYSYASGWGTATALTINVGSSSATGGGLGTSVALAPDGNAIIVGAPYSSSTGAYNLGGAAFRWTYSGGAWGSRSTAGPTGLSGDFYGNQVSDASNNRMGATATGRSTGGFTSNGGAFVVDITP